MKASVFIRFAVAAVASLLVAGSLQAGPVLDVTSPGDLIVGTSTNYPVNESPPNAIDNDPNTKYLNFDKLNSGFTVTPLFGASYLTGIALTTANDATERDPMTVTITGSNDGLLWLPVITDLATPLSTDRYTESEFSFMSESAGTFLMYRVIFPTVRNPGSANSMQIGEVRLMGVPEPATLALMGLGTLGVWLGRRKR